MIHQFMLMTTIITPPTKEQITIKVLSLVDNMVTSGMYAEPSSSFDDLELDSLDRTDLFASIEREFGIAISDRHMPTSVQTVSELINIVYISLHPEQI